jgi:hypothetical protein
MDSKFISYNESPPPVNGLRQAFIELYNQLPYEVFLTFSFGAQIGSIRAFREVNNFLKRFKKGAFFKEIKFCGINLFVISKLNQCHVHTLLISDPRYPRRLNQVDCSSLRSRYITSLVWEYPQIFWEDILKNGSFRYKDIYDLKILGRYLASEKNMNFFDMDKFNLGFFRHKMLCQLNENNLRIGDYMLTKKDNIKKTR